jgi:hypothetical protein
MKVIVSRNSFASGYGDGLLVRHTRFALGTEPRGRKKIVATVWETHRR